MKPLLDLVGRRFREVPQEDSRQQSSSVAAASDLPQFVRNPCMRASSCTLRAAMPRGGVTVSQPGLLPLTTFNSVKLHTPRVCTTHGHKIA